MTDHPEFPQESPAMKYVISQVSKIEETSNCTTGYYNSLGKVLKRLDKTDIELNRLHQATTDLTKIVDSQAIATILGKKSKEHLETLQNGIILTSNMLNRTTDENLKKMRSDHSAIIGEISATNDKAKEIQTELESAVLTITTTLENHIKDVSARLSPPLWKVWGYILLSLVIGYGFGFWAAGGFSK
jgi:hypothetical protein